MAEAPEQLEDEKSSRRQKLVGVVSSTFGDKTIRVVVIRMVKHPQYGKYQKRRTKLAAHDATNQAKLGDTVEITPCRRISKMKSYRLLRVIRSSGGVITATAAVES
jgi:small subunit ribosomal protein S17